MSTKLIIALLILAAFWGVLYLIYGRREEEELKEEGLEVDLLVAMWRTKRLLNFIDRTARKAKRFWKAYATIGVLIGFAGMAYVFYALFQTALASVRGGFKTPGVQLVIPGVTIPLWYGLVGLVVVMVVHELSHGVVARAEGLRLKSVGLVLLAVIPGAFVEPDEDEIKKAPLLSRLRVYAAGSMANIVTALLALLLINYALGPVLVPNGVEITNFDPNGPAKDFLMKGDVIVGINGQSVMSVEDFLKVMNSTRAGETIALQVERAGKVETIRITLADNPSNPGKGYLGVYPSQRLRSKIGAEWLVLPIAFSLYWVYVLNFGIGLMNLFPLVPLDGGKMLDETLREFLPEGIAKPISYAFIAIGLLLLGINLLPALAGLAG
ncbi:site-2 protease family protein [Palaeococcus ferrophilus]|uniref:site-2 protease family protein n=1 Tax=Palaeococcus ferrophilus TaxID=83868 RepID=UPI00064FA368|nr:site-2 protease family protein [Palaeococcus ferrophilus]